MYDDGKHINAIGEDGRAVVEYYRCGGFEWEPVSLSRETGEKVVDADFRFFSCGQTPSDDVKDNLVCLDGALRDLGRGGKLATRAVGVEQTGLRVWA
jgi:hypothetical protein